MARWSPAKWIRGGWTREHLIRAGLALALLAGVLATAFGTGYRTSHALLDGAGAYVQKGHTVVRVNAESRDTDAQAKATAKRLARGNQRLEVIQVSPGVVYVVNNETGEVWRLPTDTMQPQQVPLPPGQNGAKNALRVVSGGGRAYVLDTKHGTLTLLEGPKGRGQTPVRLPRQVTDVVVDSSGTAWALSQQGGELYALTDGPAVTHRVAAPWEPVWLTLAGDRPVVYRPGRGTATMFDRKGAAGRVDLPKESNAAGIQVASPGTDSRVLVATSRTKGELVKADFSRGAEQRTQLAGRAGHNFGAPVVSRDRVYVPDYTARHVVVLELASLRQVESVPVPGVTYFQVFARDNRVWVNDPYDRYMLSFDRNGRRTQIDKSQGASEEERRAPIAPPSLKPGLPENSGEKPDEPERQVRVPDVEGLDESAAEREVERKDLVFRKVTRQDDCATGKALGSDPAPGTAVRARSAVAVLICGPTAVPNLVGMTVEQAQRALEQARLNATPRAGGVLQSPDQLRKVFQQNPPAGTPLSTDGTVTVDYYDPQAGSQVAVPNLANMTDQQACQSLQAMLLTCSPTAVPHQTATGVHGQDPAAGAAVPPGAPVRFNYQAAAPVPLNRHKAEGVESRFLSLAATPPAGGAWLPYEPIGRAYAPEAVGPVPGLVPIQQAGCTDCDEKVLYFYARTADRPAQPDGKWSAAQPVFSCFAPATAPPGTIPLWRMFKDYPQGRRWAFAPEGSGEHTQHLTHGYGNEKVLCHVWPRP